MTGPVGCVLQPTFMPWLGWFDIVDQCEVLVILDDVGFSKQSWQQRNRIRGAGGLEILSVPVWTAGLLGQPIDAVELADPRFEARTLGRVRGNYCKAPHFAELFPEFEDAVREGVARGRLIDVNMSIIRWAMSKLGLETSIVTSRTLDVPGMRGEKVAALGEVTGMRTYLSPAGASDYLAEDVASFDRRGIDVRIQSYEHPAYRQQFEPFLSHASIVDLLFNEGPESAAIMRSGRCDSLALPRMEE